jgi:hypothetical protein
MRASIASSSPLVAHDQRLNIPEFAAAPPPSMAASSPGMAPAEGVEPGPFGGRLLEPKRVAQEVIVTETFRPAPGSPIATHAAQTTLEPSSAGVTPASFERSSPSEARDVAARIEPTGKPERARRSHYVDEGPDPIERAFAEANAWLRSPPSERRALEAPPPRVAAAIREATARGVPALNRSLERPSLTIGAINVEVVAPPALPGVSAAKAVVRREAAPRGRSSGAPFGARPSFGWRQR